MNLSECYFILFSKKTSLILFTFSLSSHEISSEMIFIETCQCLSEIFQKTQITSFDEFSDLYIHLFQLIDRRARELIGGDDGDGNDHQHVDMKISEDLKLN